MTRPTTSIVYALPEAVPVRLVVYDLLGRAVATLVDGIQPAGRHEVRFEAGGLSTGFYLYRIETPSWTDTRTMLLVK